MKEYAYQEIDSEGIFVEFYRLMKASLNMEYNFMFSRFTYL